MPWTQSNYKADWLIHRLSQELFTVKKFHSQHELSWDGYQIKMDSEGCVTPTLFWDIWKTWTSATPTLYLRDWHILESRGSSIAESSTPYRLKFVYSIWKFCRPRNLGLLLLQGQDTAHFGHWRQPNLGASVHIRTYIQVYKAS